MSHLVRGAKFYLGASDIFRCSDGGRSMADDNGTHDLFTALETCRAVRHLKPDPVPRALLERLVHYATRASNPGNSQLWSFVILQDPAKKQRIADAVAKVMKPAMGSRTATTPTEKRMYEGAAHLIGSLARVPAIVFVCAKNGYPPGNPNLGFVWSAVYPASQNLIVAARGLGLGTTFTTFHMVAEAVVRDTLGLPDEQLIGTTICVGYPEKPFGPVKRKPVGEVIIGTDGDQGFQSRNATWAGSLRAAGLLNWIASHSNHSANRGCDCSWRTVSTHTCSLRHNTSISPPVSSCASLNDAISR
jgi:nitroreductase